MYTARTDYIAHLETGKATIGLATVKAYAGEIREAVKNPKVLRAILPAALVILENGGRGAHHGDYLFHTLVCTHTTALQTDKNADDALKLAAAMATWLEDNFTWSAAGINYMIDIDRQLRVDTLMIEPSYSIVQVTFDLRELY